MEVMLDLETLSVRPHAVILTIGAIKFKRNSHLPPLRLTKKFYRRITISSCEAVGLHTDIDTVKWWNEQDEKVKHEALSHPDRVPLKQALQEFSKWFRGSYLIWGHGDDFDCTILGEAYKRCGMEIPWRFWNTRDTRTLFDLAGLKKDDLPSSEMDHHAIHDCYRQIIGVKKALDIMR